MIFVIRVGLVDDDLGVLDRLPIVLDDQAGPARDHVQRGAQLVSDAGRERPTVVRRSAWRS